MLAYDNIWLRQPRLMVPGIKPLVAVKYRPSGAAPKRFSIVGFPYVSLPDAQVATTATAFDVISQNFCVANLTLTRLARRITQYGDGYYGTTDANIFADYSFYTTTPATDFALAWLGWIGGTISNTRMITAVDPTKFGVQINTSNQIQDLARYVVEGGPSVHWTTPALPVPGLFAIAVRRSYSEGVIDVVVNGGVLYSTAETRALFENSYNRGLCGTMYVANSAAFAGAHWSGNIPSVNELCGFTANFFGRCVPA